MGSLLVATSLLLASTSPGRSLEASIELHRQSMGDPEFDQLICEGVVWSNRLVPEARELGMWEQMWRSRRAPDGD